jgi:hypothetical protein
VPQVQRRLLEGTASQEKEAAAQNARIVSLNQQIAALRQQYAQQLFKERLAQLPAAIRADVQMALATVPAKRNVVQKYLAGKFQNDLQPPPQLLAQILLQSYSDYRNRLQALEAALKKENVGKLVLAEIRAFYDLPGAARTHLLRRGDYLNPGPLVQPGTLSVLATPEPFTWKAPAKTARTSGRRLAFARWLTQRRHPLTARVMVNRLWMHHFGEGIVRTVDNFGHTGSPPSHPELLDWLVTEFVQRGWSLKAMHRLMLTSSAYRQSSRLDPERHATALKLDPDNRLLWRQRLRRLSAEEMRDSILSVGGDLGLKMFGPPVPVQRHGDGEVTTAADPSGKRRSIYLLVRRSQPLTMLQIFDQPVMETNCTRRSRSTVPLQALTLLNSDFMVRQADTFAARVLMEKPPDLAAHALKLAFHRPATAVEQSKLSAFLRAQSARHLAVRAIGKQIPTQAETELAQRRALADLCHMLMSANEFAYVD